MCHFEADFAVLFIREINLSHPACQTSEASSINYSTSEAGSYVTIESNIVERFSTEEMFTCIVTMNKKGKS
jgi:hypothetical protein